MLDISSAFDAVDHATLIDHARTWDPWRHLQRRSFVTEHTADRRRGKSAVFASVSSVPQARS